MTNLRSRSLVSQFRTLFAGGTFSGLGEGELLERFVGHRDDAAFAELVARHGPMVLAVCRRWLDDPHDVEDAFQATFLVLVRKAGGLRDRESVAQWLYGVSHRIARHARAAAVRRREREMRTVARRREGAGRAAGPDPADDLASREILAMVHDELARLPEKQQAAAVLCLVQGLSHEAAARALGWPLGTLKTRIADARATLSRRLARRGVTPSCVAAVAGLDFNLPVSSLSNELMLRTIDAALRLIADPAMKTGVIGASVATMVREVSRMMILARLGLVLVVLAALSAAVWAVSSLLTSPAGIPQAADSSTGPPEAAARTQSKAGSENTPRRDLYGDPLPAGAVVRLGTVRYRQSSPIHRIAYSSDGKYVVTDGDDGLLRIWDAGDGRLIRRIDAGVGVIADFALGSDPKTVMTVGTSFELERPRGVIRHATGTDLTNGERLWKTSWPTEYSNWTLALCANRRLFAIASSTGPLRVVDTTKGTEVGRFNLGNAIERMAFSPDGKRLAVLRRRNDQRGLQENLVVLDVDGKKELTSLDLELRTGNFAFSPDGSAIALISATSLKLWVLATGEVSPFKRIVKDYVLLQLSKVVPADRLAFSIDGRRLVGISNIGSISVCETSTQRLINAFGFEAATMGSAIGPVAVSRDSRTLAAVGGSHVFHFWDLEAHRDRLAMDGAHSDQVNSILVSPEGKTLLTAGDDGTVRLWDLASGQQRKVLKHLRWTDGEDPANRAATNRVVAMALSADGRLLAAATDFSRRLYVWDLERADEPLDRTEEDESFGSPGPVAVRFEENNRSIVVLDQHGDLHLWDRRDPRPKPLKRPPLSKPEPPFEGFHDDYRQGIFLAGGKRLAVIGHFNGLQVADMVNAKELYRVKEANLLATSPDQRTLAIARSGSHTEFKWVPEKVSSRPPMLKKIPTDGTIVLLDSETGKEKLQINVSGSEVRALAFAPDGKTLAATTGWDTGQIHFFDVASGQETRTIDTPPLQSPALAFTPDGSRLISAMADGSVLVWDVKPLR